MLHYERTTGISSKKNHFYSVRSANSMRLENLFVTFAPYHVFEKGGH